MLLNPPKSCFNKTKYENNFYQPLIKKIKKSKKIISKTCTTVKVKF